MVQTKGQQQTFQRTIDERSQNRRSLGRVGDPDAKVVEPVCTTGQNSASTMEMTTE